LQRIVITSDLQIPYHHNRQLKSHLRFIADWQPDYVLNIGDLIDLPQPSRWNTGTREEFRGTVQRDVETTKRIYFEALRSVYSGPVGMHIGNHDERAEKYAIERAPALIPEDGPNPYRADILLDFDGFGVEDVGGFYDLAPGWVSTHGHLGTPLRQVGGGSAIAAARKIGKSIVQGHTHRMGIIHETTGYSAKATTVTGFEVGNMMDMRKADYVMRKSGMANWHSGFGVLYVDGNTVQPIGVKMNRDGSFLFEGRKWK
jgi:hypothetical protein